MKLLSDRKTEKIAEIISEKCGQRSRNILVVGCGSGLEAAILAQRLGASVTGIDAAGKFDAEAASIATLETGDALSLRFADSSFDLVYSYHALEHIGNPKLALEEMRRVLREGGMYWIGVPNRSRFLGYIGSKDATLKEKVEWNIADWKARLQGRFRNELGAHAGFTSEELRSLLGGVFSTCEEMSDAYYERIYSRKKPFITFLERSGLSRFAYPGVYFMGAK